ncbi:unnamed protein product [Clonostachys solani]|uniref:Prokaryotic phospholipase A2-domain-containing protein n=1 Tax=Clonostachys solani TaxID=160281 RepID=A0A9P0EN49_9HYPO|nr:unnamed protein product [Clonostachys solani]
MKFPTVLVSLLQLVVASPVDLDGKNGATTSNGLVTRETENEKMTTNIVFNINLEAFAKRRKNKNPKNLIWESDNCTKSPDNPLKFPFAVACQRHDFGYNNYRKQKRLRKNGNRKKIDVNFRKDLMHQCDVHKKSKYKCKALAWVYYAFVRAYGDGGSKKRDLDHDLLPRVDGAVEISPDISPDELQTDPLYAEPDTDTATTQEELEAAYEKYLAAYHATKE